MTIDSAVWCREEIKGATYFVSSHLHASHTFYSVCMLGRLRKFCR
jgi:hypothetical protein